MMDYSKILSPVVNNLPPSGIRKFFDIAAEYDDVLSLSVGEPDFETPWHIREAGIELEFKGEGMNEVGIDKATGKVVIEVSEEFYRPTDVVNLWGDPTKAKTELGWNPTKTSFEELVKIMVKHDMEKVAVERAGEHIKMNLAEYLEKGVVK